MGGRTERLDEVFSRARSRAAGLGDQAFEGFGKIDKNSK
jgi:hypothetical protein